ncbi:hypothetical protein C1645_816080 [Glomus cerebriforme]|uniref:Uncharacterized protein n=1 Tax=Glomus cerebriforme TaxID=658196 RepID=A0A397TG95_9GLOM|nr:hypothetical protein C1645_816080 [Glomus cerebriforme]
MFNNTKNLICINKAYKSSSESDIETLLNNEEAFNEFLKDYYTIMLRSKKVMVIVILKESSKKYLCQDEVLEWESDDELKDEIHQKIKSKLKLLNKYVKSYVPKEVNLDKIKY